MSGPPASVEWTGQCPCCGGDATFRNAFTTNAQLAPIMIDCRVCDTAVGVHTEPPLPPKVSTALALIAQKMLGIPDRTDGAA